MTTRPERRGGAGRTPVEFGVPVLVLRRGGFSVLARRRPLVVTFLIALAAALLAVVALGLGDVVLSPGEVAAALTGRADGISVTVVRDWRLPRVIAALAFGAALGVSGAVFQSVTRNPLASPDVIGLTAGAYAGGLGAIIVFGGGLAVTAAGSLAGGLLATVLVYVLAWRRGVSGLRLIIVGIAMTAMCSAVATYLILRARLEVAMTAAVWGAGTLGTVTWPTVWAVLPGLALAGVGLLCAQRSMAILELGDDAARSLGERPNVARTVLIVLAVILTAAVVAVAGPIAFVSLAAPQVARRLADTAGVALGPSAALGALLLLGSDVVAQHLLPVPLPVGVVTVVVGGVYLCWMLMRETRRTS